MIITEYTSLNELSNKIIDNMELLPDGITLNLNDIEFNTFKNDFCNMDNILYIPNFQKPSTDVKLHLLGPLGTNIIVNHITE